MITFAVEATAAYRVTLARHPPETGAVLGGRPSDPFRVLDLRFLPAQRRPDGSPNATSGYFEPDMHYVNHILVKEWQPAGLTILGYIHSHPDSLTRLSRGEPGSNVGDIVAIKADLAAAKQVGIDWPFALMPIVTFDADGRDIVTGWVVTPDQPEPYVAEVIFEERSPVTSASPREVLNLRSVSDQLMASADFHQSQINKVLGVGAAPAEDRQFVAAQLRALMRAEISTLMRDAAGQSPLAPASEGPQFGEDRLFDLGS